jgi:hypothetical protein
MWQSHLQNCHQLRVDPICIFKNSLHGSNNRQETSWPNQDVYGDIRTIQMNVGILNYDWLNGLIFFLFTPINILREKHLQLVQFC